MINLEDLDTLLHNPKEDGIGNTYWEWPDLSGRHLIRVFLMGDDEKVVYGVWKTDVPVLEAPLYAEGTHLRGSGAAKALIRRWRTSQGDERFLRIVLAGLGIPSGSPE